MADNYTDAVNAINDKIKHHAGMAADHKDEIEGLTRKIGQETEALSVHQTAVRSLEKARKILVDAENASRENDKPEF